MIELVFGMLAIFNRPSVAMDCDTESCWVEISHPIYELPPHALALKPCEHEDSPGPCHWDARERGNRKGRSFWVTSNGVVHLTLDPDIA